VLVLLATFALARSARAQETVNIDVPASVGFAVVDMSESTSAGSMPSTITFSSASLAPGHTLRISVKADSDDFTPPSGPSIPVSKVSWTTGTVSGGAGYSGTLSSTSYVVVMETFANPSSGHVDVNWELAAPGGGIRAGDHALQLRWKFESLGP
jgi:hypothetical protein